MSLPLALTCGEPAGIGADIALATWRNRAVTPVPPFYVIGDPAALRRRADAIGWRVPVLPVAPHETEAAFADALPVVDVGREATAEPGVPDDTSAAVAIVAIDRAVADVIGGVAAAVVTNPVAKSVLYRAGFEDPGHTEYLARLATRHTGKPCTPVMMLWAPALAVVPVTIHLAYRLVIERLTADLIVETGEIVARDMKARFGLPAPRLAVAGLNPHAGESGTLGTEDQTVVAPAVAELRRRGINARGPLPADTMFHAAARATYDAALCMYHDQALIPIKTLAFDHAVNVTLGLPFVRTSPDHGTAFDIAGTGTADPSSLVAALRLAARLSAPTPAKAKAVAPA